VQIRPATSPGLAGGTPEDRKLIAIFHADMFGYSQLIGLAHPIHRIEVDGAV
jgi:hypothetical protein